MNITLERLLKKRQNNTCQNWDYVTAKRPVFLINVLLETLTHYQIKVLSLLVWILNGLNEEL